MPVDHYLVFYIPDNAAGVVTVIRVMYAGRNVDAQLKKHTVL
jgi:toxin ParE1/3/4